MNQHLKENHIHTFGHQKFPCTPLNTLLILQMYIFTYGQRVELSPSAGTNCSTNRSWVPNSLDTELATTNGVITRAECLWICISNGSQSAR